MYERNDKNVQIKLMWASSHVRCNLGWEKPQKDKGHSGISWINEVSPGLKKCKFVWNVSLNAIYMEVQLHGLNSAA
jgi:hypothetical protein